MPAPTQVPDETVLRKFLLGELPPAELEEIAQYLDSHPDVSANLASLAASDPLLSALHLVPAQSSVETPALSGLVTRISDLLRPNPSQGELNASTVIHDPSGDEDQESMFAGLLTSQHVAGEIGRFAEFRVIRELGRGGMGIVFEAEDAKLGRKIALKIMAPALAANPTAKKRFLQEAKTAAAVEHDHIVPIFHIGEDARGLPYLVMPLLVGENLDDCMKDHEPLPVAEVLPIGRQIADGLAAAHAAGLIHRDIKPSNIWLEKNPNGTFRRVRILDFGLARSVRTTSENLTHSGAIMGTPSYMSPEQARGLAVDHRADLFSLGAVLYQMTTGRRPFSGMDTFAVLTSLATETPPAPISVNPNMSPELSELIMWLLAKNPVERKPSSAQEVSEALGRIGALPRAASPAKPRHRRALLAIAAVLFLGLAALAVANGPTIIRVINNEGELIVEVDDDSIEVVVKGTTVEILDPKGKRYLVSAGKDGEVEIRENGTDSVLVMEKFRVKRGDKVVVTVTNDKLAAARKKEGEKPKEVATGSKLSAGDSPPAKDAFPGALAFYDTFDDPKKTTLRIGKEGELDSAVEKGVYAVTWPNAKAGQWFANIQSPPVFHSAFATRLRVENGGIGITFRNGVKGTHRQWLNVVIDAAGNWALTRLDRIEKDGKADPSVKTLARGDAPDPALASGQWIAVVGRATGNDYEVWINGKLVARGTDEGTPNEAVELRGVAIGGLTTADGRSRIEVDYLAVWDLSGASAKPSLPAPLTAEQRKALTWFAENGGGAGFNVNGETVAYGKGDKLPEGPVIVLGVANYDASKLTQDDYLSKIAQLPAGLREVQLAYSQFTNDGLARLASMPNLADLEILGIGCDSITDDGLVHLAKFRKLKRLHLGSSAGIKGPGLVHLRGLPLEFLSLYCCPVDDDAMATVAGFSELKTLNVMGTHISPIGLAMLHKLPKLTELEMDRDGVSNAVANALAKYPALATLMVRPDKDESVVKLTALPKLIGLTVNWGSDPVPEAHVLELAQFKKLKTLRLNGEKLHKATVQKLANALPQCTVELNNERVKPE